MLTAAMVAMQVGLGKAGSLRLLTMATVQAVLAVREVITADQAAPPVKLGMLAPALAPLPVALLVPVSRPGLVVQDMHWPERMAIRKAATVGVVSQEGQRMVTHSYRRASLAAAAPVEEETTETTRRVLVAAVPEDLSGCWLKPSRSAGPLAL